MPEQLTNFIYQSAYDYAISAVKHLEKLLHDTGALTHKERMVLALRLLECSTSLLIASTETSRSTSYLADDGNVTQVTLALREALEAQSGLMKAQSELIEVHSNSLTVIQEIADRLDQ